MFMTWNSTNIWKFSPCHPLVSKRDINLGWECQVHWSRKIELKAFASLCHEVSNWQFSTTVWTALKRRVHGNNHRVSGKQLLHSLFHGRTFSHNWKSCWDSECQKLRWEKTNPPAVLSLLVPVLCLWWLQMATKYLSHLPKLVPAFMIVFGTVMIRSHRYGGAYQVYKSSKHILVSFYKPKYTKLAP